MSLRKRVESEERAAHVGPLLEHHVHELEVVVSGAMTMAAIYDAQYQIEARGARYEGRMEIRCHPVHVDGLMRRLGARFASDPSCRLYREGNQLLFENTLILPDHQAPEAEWRLIARLSESRRAVPGERLPMPLRRIGPEVLAYVPAEDLERREDDVFERLLAADRALSVARSALRLYRSGQQEAGAELIQLALMWDEASAAGRVPEKGVQRICDDLKLEELP